MLHLDISATLGSAITPSRGIPDQEMKATGASMRRYIEDFLKERETGAHPWSMAPYDQKTAATVKEIAAQALAGGIRTVVWIGIGGSGLGPKAIQEIFEGPDTAEFILLDMIDPAVLDLYMRIIDWENALVVVASKSGETLETMSAFFLCWERLEGALKERAHERVIAVTDPLGGALRRFCLENGVRMLAIPPDVGGRFSIFTPVGLLPLALLRADTDRFLLGAKEIDTLCQNKTPEDNPAALLAAVQFLLDTRRDCPVRVIMPYAQRLESVARWDQQMIAESLGKAETHNPIPLAAIGTQDQHSLLQQWMAGPRACWHLFIREAEKPPVRVPGNVEESFGFIAGKTFGELLDACYEGTSRALTGAKRPHATITLPTLDEYHLGQLFFLFCTEVVLLGKLYRIDPYGQPAVEIGKKITKEILSGGGA